MTSEEIEESQSAIEDGGMGGPGAPTPLSALEASLTAPNPDNLLTSVIIRALRA